MSNAITFFVGGTSGSGKSTLLTRLTVLHPHITHVVASRLLHDTYPACGSGRRLSVTTFKQAEAFQVEIARRFLDLRREVTGPIVLDGHYVVPTAQGPFCLPSSVFERMAIDAFIVLESAPEVVAERLRLRADAAWWDGRVESLRDAISLEIRHAHEVARALRRNIAVVDEAHADAENLLWNEISR